MKKAKIIYQIECDLNELSNIERDLFYEIVINGKNIIDSIHNVSLVYKCDELDVIENYYPTINKKIKELIKIVFMDNERGDVNETN